MSRPSFLNQFYNGATMNTYKDEDGEIFEGCQNQSIKADKGKIKPTLVPTQIIRDIATVREYGCKKYKDPNNWKKVEIERYEDAFLRHTLAWMDSKKSRDDESGIEHYKHMACNLAFLCEMYKEDEANGKMEEEKAKR